MKSWSTLYIIRENMINTIVRYHYTSIRMAKMRGKNWQYQMLIRIWNNRNSNCYWECKMIHSLEKTVWQFLANPSTLFCQLGIYSLELKISIHTKPHTWMFRDALFIITKKCKQLRCPSIGEQTYWGISRPWNIIQWI